MIDPSSLIDLGLGALALRSLRSFKKEMVAAVERVGTRIDGLDRRVRTIETQTPRENPRARATLAGFTTPAHATPSGRDSV